MNVLSGRAHYGKSSGVIKVNGTPMALSSLKSLVEFVPQDDIVHSTLTVYENILYSAMFHSHMDTKSASVRKHINEIVEQTISIFMLGHIRDAIVGDVEHRGISGGQRKRVSIAVAIVGEPLLLFLDEPTSGLDATYAQVRSHKKRQWTVI